MAWLAWWHDWRGGVVVSNPANQGLPRRWIELMLGGGLAIGRQIARVAMLFKRRQVFEGGAQELARRAVVRSIHRCDLGLVHGQAGAVFGEP